MSSLMALSAERHYFTRFGVVGVMPVKGLGRTAALARFSGEDSLGYALRFGFLSVLLAVFSLILRVPVLVTAVRAARVFFRPSPFSCVVTGFAHICESIRAGVSSIKFRDWLSLFAFTTMFGGHGVTTSVAGLNSGDSGLGLYSNTRHGRGTYG